MNKIIVLDEGIPMFDNAVDENDTSKILNLQKYYMVLAIFLINTGINGCCSLVAAHDFKKGRTGKNSEVCSALRSG